MGNLISCENEPKDESVISLSEDCINRLTSEPCEDDKEEQPRVPSHMVVSEDRWMSKLAKMDECHSCRRNLSVTDIDKLFDKIEDAIGEVGKEFCPFQDVLTCLKENSCDMIKCLPVLDEFIDCVDTVRIERIKRRYEEESNLPTNDAENNICKEFMKSK